jgi:hypothetical protein
VTDLETSFQQEKLDHQRETRFNRDIQLHEMELMQQISQIKNIMVSANMVDSHTGACADTGPVFRIESLSSSCF